MKSGLCRFSVEYFCITAAQFIMQLTHYVTEAERVCVFGPNGGEAPSYANNLLYSIMATERTAREKDCRAKLPK